MKLLHLQLTQQLNFPNTPALQARQQGNFQNGHILVSLRQKIHSDLSGEFYITGEDSVDKIRTGFPQVFAGYEASVSVFEEPSFKAIARFERGHVRIVGYRFQLFGMEYSRGLRLLDVEIVIVLQKIKIKRPTLLCV